MASTRFRLLRLFVPFALIFVVTAPSAEKAAPRPAELSFFSLDGSVEDADGAADGVWTVAEDFVLAGRLGCAETGDDAGDCRMRLRVEGDLELLAGSAIVAGGGLSLEVAGDLKVATGAFVVSERGHVALSADGDVVIAGLVTAGGRGRPESPALSIAAHGGPESGFHLASSGAILTTGDRGSGNTIELSGCGLEVYGLVAAAGSGAHGSVSLRSCTGIRVDGSDLLTGRPGGARRGQIEVSGRGRSTIDLWAVEAVELTGSELRAGGGPGGRIEIESARGRVNWRRGRGEAGAGAGSIHLAACTGVDTDGSLLAPAPQISDSCAEEPETEDAPLHGGALDLFTPQAAEETTALAPVSCTPNLAIDNQVITTIEEFVACDTLTSANTRIIPRGYVTYRAGKLIVLDNGFSVENANFIAILDPTLNQPPVAVDDAVATDEDTVLAGDVLAANPTTPDSDPDGNPLTVTEVESNAANVGVQFALASGALLTVNADGTFSYDPNGAFDTLSLGDSTTDTFTYQIGDGNGAFDTATVTITITGVNDCAVAVDDALSTDEDTFLNGDVLVANPTTPDSDPESDPLTVTEVEGNAANVGVQIPLGAGLLTVNANGTMSFDPNGGYEALGAGGSAQEMFTYTIDDGSSTCAETATVTITIHGVNDPPVITSDGGGATAMVNAVENQTAVTDVESTDPEGETEGAGLTYSLTGGADQGFFTIDPNTGALTFLAPPDFENPLDDDGNGIYEVQVTVTDSGGLNDLQDISVTVTNVNDPPFLAAGEVKLIESQVDGAAGVDGLDGAEGVAVSADGKHVYATGESEDAVAVFTRNATTGQLTFVEVHFDGASGVDGLDGAREVIVSRDGQHVYVGGNIDDAVAVFDRDTTTGQLTFVEFVQDGVGGVDVGALNAVFDLAESPDGRHIYVASSAGAAVAVFSRDATTGQLTFVEALFDGVDVTNLNQAQGVVVSGDGAHVYVTGRLDDTVNVFDRDPTTGQLTLAQEVTDGSGGVDGINGVRSVTLSPDGKNLYTAAFDGDEVAVFTRDDNPASGTYGELAYVENFVDGSGGVDGLDFAADVKVSADGANVYVVGQNDNALAVFSRNPATGQLTFVEALMDGAAGGDSLEAPRRLALSGDGRHVYVSAHTDDALTLFSREGSSALFTVGGGPVDLLSGIAFTVTDQDDTNLESATATITNPLDTPNETLAVVTGGTSIVANYVAATGILTLTGTDTLANYQAVLRSLTYDNSSVPPDFTTRLVEVVANDGDDDSNTFTVMVMIENRPPEITSDGGGATAAVNTVDGTTAVTDVESTDPDGETEGVGLTYSLTTTVDGVDNGFFTLDPNTGVLTFTSAPSVGTPQDDDGNNDYEVEVTVTDSQGLTDTQNITVTVIDPPPVGGPDAFDFVGNTLLLVDKAATGDPEIVATTTSTLGVLDNDSDPSDPISVTGVFANMTDCADMTAPFTDCPTANGGTVTMESTGQFSYTPAPGDTAATDMFGYKLTGGATTVDVIVTLTRKNTVWYVKNDNASGTDDGSSTDPFDTLAEAEAASVAGDTIYVFEGDGTDTGQDVGIALKDMQRLLGEGVDLTVADTVNGVAGPTLFDSATNNRAVVSHAAGDAVAVDATAGGRTAIEIRGLELSASGNAVDVTATGTFAAGVTISDNLFDSSGAEAVDLNPGSSGDFTATVEDNTFSTSSPTGNAIDLTTTAAAGTVEVAVNRNTDVTSSAGDGIRLDGSAGGTLFVTGFADNTVHGNTGGTGVIVRGATFDADPSDADFDPVAGGTTTIGSLANPVGGSGLLLGDVLARVSGNLAFTRLDVFNSSGLSLLAVGSAGVPPAGGLELAAAAGTIRTATGRPVTMDSVTVAASGITFDSITTTSTTVPIHVPAMHFNNMSGGTFDGGVVTLFGLSFAVNSDGLEILNNQATFLFDSFTVDGQFDRAVDIASNAGSVTFQTVDIDGPGSRGINTLLNSGTIRVNGGAIGATNDIFGQGGVRVESQTATGSFNLVGVDVTSSSSDGFAVLNSAGMVTVTGGTFTNTGTNDTLDVSGGSATVAIGADLVLTGSGGANAVVEINGSSGNITLSGNVTSTSTNGDIQIGHFSAITAGTISFTGSSINLSGGAGGDNGINIANVNAGASVVFSAGTAITSTGGQNGFDFDNVAGTVQVGGTVDVSNTSAAGIAVSGSSGTVTFSGATTVDNATVATGGAGVALDNNGGGAIGFSGALDIDATTGAGFSATGGGTVTVTGAGSTVDVTTGTAVDIANTTIGAGNVTFLSVSKDGGSSPGIVLDTTGSGTFTVAGDGGTSVGGNGSGGTIQNIANADAIRLKNTDGRVTLKNLLIEDIGSSGDGAAINTRSGHDAIHGEQVDGGLTLESVRIRRISDNGVNGTLLSDGITPTTWTGLEIKSSVVENTNRFHVAGKGDDGDEGGVRIDGLTGTVAITGSTFQNGASGLDLISATGAGTLDITIQSNTFNNIYKEFACTGTVNVGRRGITVEAEGSHNVVARIGDPAEASTALGNNLHQQHDGFDRRRRSGRRRNSPHGQDRNG